MSGNMEWGTPQGIFKLLDAEFGFTLDPCATSSNTKCEKYFTKADDGLSQSWDNERVFCNPPYGREIYKWVEKASKARGGIVVMLLPASTDTGYFHEFIYHRAEIRFLRGRLFFINKKGKGVRAQFPSMVVIFGGKRHERYL